MRNRTDFCADWQFHQGTNGELLHQATKGQTVRLPHNAVELPFSYFDETIYQHPFTYQKTLAYDPIWAGKEVALIFDAAMADAKVYLNGVLIGAHRDGYTPFRVRLNGHLNDGQNLLTVVIDGSENPGIPPFGGTIDYLTYAGIYREVWLEVSAPVSIGKIKIETPDVLRDKKSARVLLMLDNPQDLPLEGEITVALYDAENQEIASQVIALSDTELEVTINDLSDITLWSPETPVLYSIKATLKSPHGQDELQTAFGFREVDFTTNGFFINGQHLKLRGLNRHQSFPYVGYALLRAAQERDVEIVRFELGCNVVRSSHYPPSPWFLDHCDRIGLLVLEEIPGWQHIGDEAWKAASIENVVSMIERDWNHPSVIMWGVRINESFDDHDFYIETNHVAHTLDSTRPRGGIRCIENSELLEDIYTMNDFILARHEVDPNQPRVALRSQREVTGLDHDVPYLVTEYNGHMFPTKNFDQEQRQMEHVMRHLQVLDASYADDKMAGCIGWCAFDYNTHSDFGSGDMICYHGVMDMFREPKFAAYAYLSQVAPSERVVMEPATFWTRGDRNIGGSFPLVVLTNCDEVEIVYANLPPRKVKPDRDAFPHLPHAPVIIDNRHFTTEELTEWGSKWHDATLVGYVNGKPVAKVFLPGKKIPTTLEIVPDRSTLARAGDCVRVIVRALDQVGRKLPFLFEPVSIEVTGAARLIGPSLVSLRGGSTGFWIESTGAKGDITISVHNRTFGRVGVNLVAEGNN